MYAIVYFTVEIDTLVCRCSYNYVSHAKKLGTSSTSSHMHIRQVIFLLLRCSCGLSREQLYLQAGVDSLDQSDVIVASVQTLPPETLLSGGDPHLVTNFEPCINTEIRIINAFHINKFNATILYDCRQYYEHSYGYIYS